MRLDEVPREVLVGVAALAVAYAFVASLRGFVASARLRRRFARARDGEQEAVVLLEAADYEIEGAQVVGQMVLHVDGEALAADVRADYLVRRRGRRFVAEVKTGRAARLDTAATRRQLLEYAHAFDADGVLLVDADAKRIHRVEFDLRSRPSRPSMHWLYVLLIAILAILVASR